MTKRIGFLAAVACMCTFGVSAAWAGEGCCAKGKDAKTASAKGSCSLAGKVCGGDMKEFPSMKVMVGDESFECPMAAAAAAKKADTKATYIVMGEKFDDGEKAYAAYACAAECYAKNFGSIGVERDGKWAFVSSDGCCKSGSSVKMASGCAKDQDKTLASADFKTAKKFRVAGHDYNNWDEAMKASKKAQESMKAVKMTYVVDGKTVDSADDVCPMAKKDGKVEYRVGSDKTNCCYEAKVLQAKAQVEAAKKAVEGSMAKA